MRKGLTVGIGLEGLMVEGTSCISKASNCFLADCWIGGAIAADVLDDATDVDGPEISLCLVFLGERVVAPTLLLLSRAPSQRYSPQTFALFLLYAAGEEKRMTMMMTKGRERGTDLYRVILSRLVYSPKEHDCARQTEAAQRTRKTAAKDDILG